MLVYALARERNERAGRPWIPETVIEKPPSAELRPDQKDSDSLPDYAVLDPILEGYVERDRSVGELDRRRLRRRDRGAGRAARRPQRVQAPSGPARCPGVAEGLRQGPPAADHQRLARLTRRFLVITGLSSRAVAAARLPPGARDRDRGDPLRVDVHDRAGRARRPDTVGTQRVPLRVGCRGPRALRAARGAGADRQPRPTDSRRTLFVGGLVIGTVATGAYFCQNLGLQHTTTSNSAFITGLFAVTTPIIESIVFRHSPRRAIWVAVAMSVFGLFLLTGAEPSLGFGDGVTLVTAVLFGFWFVLIGVFANRVDVIGLTAVQLATVAVLSLPIALVEGFGTLTVRRRARDRASPASAARRSRSASRSGRSARSTRRGPACSTCSSPSSPGSSATRSVNVSASSATSARR